MKFAARYNNANMSWRWMLAIDFVIAVCGLLYSVFLDTRHLVLYVQFLVTYHFGFIRRALVGTVVSWFTDIVPFWYVYAIAVAAWILTLILFIAAFRKVFGFSERKLPLFAFMAGSPFFFKNFAISLGHFDIFGCLWALVALLIPAGRLYPLIIGAGSIALVVMHNLHFLLYLPTIAFIVFVRCGLIQGLSRGKIIYGGVLVLLVLAAFVVTTFYGRPPVPREVFIAYLTSRARDPIDAWGGWMWYSTISDEVRSTWDHAGITLIRLPVYAALIGLHLPVWRYLKSLITALPKPSFRIVSVAALAAILLGYLVICVVTYDYARWVSNWGVCMFLAMHAIRLLPSTDKAEAVPIEPDKSVNLALGWTLTAIPRVGVTIPF
jgi:hypothetical protein